jgi:small-conductance mechanosensitive channel
MMLSATVNTLLQFAAARWAIAIAFFIAWTSILLLVKRLCLSAARRYAIGRPRLQHLEVFLSALSPSLTIAIVAVGVAIAAQVWQMPPRWQADIDLLVMGGMVAALVVFADQVTRLWLHREAVRQPLFDEGYGIVSGAIRGVIIALGILMFLESAGISIGPLLASLGIGSLAIALGLQETVKNMFSGFFVIADKPLVVGDFVKLESGQEGQLVKLGWRSSKFQMLSDSVVIVPNSKLVDSIVTNYRANDGEIAVAVDFGVLSINDPALVERIAQEVALEVMRTVEGGVPNFKPCVRFQGITGNVMNLSVVMRATSSESIRAVRHEFVKGVLARFLREGVKSPA